jgi:hypothetical protein
VLNDHARSECGQILLQCGGWGAVIGQLNAYDGGHGDGRAVHTGLSAACSAAEPGQEQAAQFLRRKPVHDAAGRQDDQRTLHGISPVLSHSLTLPCVLGRLIRLWHLNNDKLCGPSGPAG